ncbi:uncharacterized protein LOC133175900 [Saccostrea echinata]|uniref:uncharacterized protein LOC133175900 n=1 Tax=Saccostrea echinata TaxID=191078 RepID=UPI002A7FA185|nr:uncharacterized protein LOC133175900 [Saccostrea echinata]
MLRPAEVVFSFLAFLSFGLHITGISTTEWWKLTDEFPNGTIESTSFGLWWTRTCRDDVCSVSSRNLSGELAWLLGVAAIEAVSAALYALSLPVAILLIYRGIRDLNVDVIKKLYVVVLSGAGAVIIVGIVLFVKKKAGLTERFAMATKDGVPGWSLALSSTGGALGILAGVAMGFSLLCRTKEYEDDDHHTEKPHEYWHQKHKEVN